MGENILRAARYPFLPEAREFVSQHIDLSLDSLEKTGSEAVLKRAVERVKDALIFKEVRVTPQHESNYVREILSFPIAIILVSTIANEYIRRIYSLGESRGAYKRMLKESDETLLLVGEKLGVRGAMGSNNLIRIRIPTYLNLAYVFHEHRWKLVNRIVDRGYVWVNRTEYARLLQIEINNYVYEKTLETLPVTAVPQSFKEIVKTIVETWSKLEAARPGYAAPEEKGENPPCVNRVLKRMGAGENTSHFERLLVATFMIAKGRDIEEIIELFSKQPDYKYSITKYQVEHLAGLRGGGKKYSVPSCRTILANGLCYPDENCRGVKHPLSYGGKNA
jgi:DNA primase large subunit